MQYPCPCCGYKTYTQLPGGTFDVCEVCFWEDDPVQFNDIDNVQGSNGLSLRLAQMNFLAFGAVKPEMVRFVRPPVISEQRDIELTD